MAPPPYEHARVRPPAFATMPALFAALAFAAGILAAHTLYRPPAWLLLASALCFVAILLCPRTHRAWQLTALLLAWLTTGWLLAELQPLRPPAQQRAIAIAGEQHVVTLRVTRVATPVTREGWRGSQLAMQSLDADLLTVDGAPWHERIALSLEAAHHQPLAPVACGDTFTTQAVLREPQLYRTPGAWSPANTLALRGVYLVGITHADAVTQLTHGRPTLTCRLHALQQAALERFQLAAQNTPLTPTDQAILAGALLGDRSALDTETRTAFQQTGTYHLLIVSGLSIAVIGGFLYWLLLRLRIGRVAATLSTLTLLAAYALLTGLQPPVQRALLMMVVYMLGRLYYRRLDALNAVGISAILLLAISPASLFEAGFQMTFCAVLAIAGIVSPMLARGVRPTLSSLPELWSVPNDPGLSPRIAQLRLMLRLWAQALRPFLGRWLSERAPVLLLQFTLRLAELFVVSLTLECCLAPLMAIYFHRFTALSIFANAVTFAWMLAVVPLGCLAIVTAQLSVHAAHLLMWPLGWVLHAAQAAITHLAGFHISALRIPPPATVALLAIAVLWIAATLLARTARQWLRAAACACVLAIAACTFVATPFRTADNALEVTVLDVGQGDSILVIAPSPNGPRTLLIDAGGAIGSAADPAATGERIGEDVVSNYLWQRGIRRLDAVAVTHAHQDHIGGMPAVIRNFRPREFWVGENPPVPAYEALLELAQQQGATIRHFHAGDATTFGAANIHVLSPPRGYTPSREPSNEDSLVLTAEYQHHTALLEGDAQKRSEAQMLSLSQPQSAPSVPHVDLLKVGHHGSNSSSTQEFLAAASPLNAAISSGRYNPYGHPREPVLQRLQDMHTRTWRTDNDGTITFLLDANGVHASLP